MGTKEKKLGDARDAVKAEDVTDKKDYERAEIDDADSKGKGTLPAEAVVVPVSLPKGAPRDTPDKPFGSALKRELVPTGNKLANGEDIMKMKTELISPGPVERCGMQLSAAGEGLPANGADDLDEAMVVGRLEQLAQLAHRKHPFAPTSPIAVDLDLALGCLRLMLRHDVLDKEERTRLVNRINVLLRAHPPMQLSLQVAE